MLKKGYIVRESGLSCMVWISLTTFVSDFLPAEWVTEL